jgi:serine acetyltransferase
MINNVFVRSLKSCILLVDGAYIGASAIITKNVRKNSIIVGNPNKHVKINKPLYDDKILQNILSYQK